MAETTHAWTPEEHEKLRATIRAENMLALSACGDLEAAANDRIKPWSGRDGANQQPDSTTDELVALELGRSSKTLGSIGTAATPCSRPTRRRATWWASPGSRRCPMRNA